MDSQTPQDYDEINSLESTDNESTQATSTPDSSSQQPQDTPPAGAKPPLRLRLRQRIRSVNIYLLLFVLLILLGTLGVTVAVLNSRRADDANTLITGELTPEALEQLRNSDVRVGDPKQTLNVESNAIFTGRVLIRDSLDVAGQINVGGSLSLPGITVSGTSSFDEVQINNLSISGNTSILGQLSVQSNLSVSGDVTIGGTLSAGTLSIEGLQLSSDLQLNRHINGGGPPPSVGAGGAVGGGGTVSISGSDTAGTVTINTGGGPSAGVLAVITFANPFTQTPHVVITPSSSGGAGLNYYVTRTSTGFSIATTNAPAAGTTFTFDFIAID